LTETDFVDCSIMHVLDDSQRLAAKHGARVSFQLATRPIVKRVFGVLGALEAWPVYETRADAIRAFSRALDPAKDLVEPTDRSPMARAVVS
jgi:anti-anti-sigma regulatory factor